MYSFIENPEKYCEKRAKELSQFNGCSIPEWMPKDLVNTHGENMFDSLSNHMWGSKKPSQENYAQVFETDCNKHDICYGCVSYFCNICIIPKIQFLCSDFFCLKSNTFFYIFRDLITT